MIKMILVLYPYVRFLPCLLCCWKNDKINCHNSERASESCTLSNKNISNGKSVFEAYIPPLCAISEKRPLETMSHSSFSWYSFDFLCKNGYSGIWGGNLLSFLVKLVDLDPQTRDKLGQGGFLCFVLFEYPVTIYIGNDCWKRGRTTWREGVLTPALKTALLSLTKRRP